MVIENWMNDWKSGIEIRDGGRLAYHSVARGLVE